MYALPCGRDFDQHTLFGVYALRLVELGDAPRPCKGGIGVKAQTGIDFGRHTSWQQRQNLATKAHQQAVHVVIQRSLGMLRQSFIQQRAVGRHLHCLEDERGIGGGILRLVLGNLLKVAGVGHHGGELL